MPARVNAINYAIGQRTSSYSVLVLPEITGQSFRGINSGSGFPTRSDTRCQRENEARQSPPRQGRASAGADTDRYSGVNPAADTTQSAPIVKKIKDQNR